MIAALLKQKVLIFFGVLAFFAVAIVVLVACLNNNSPSTGREILASVPTVVGKSGWSYVIRSNATVANNIADLGNDPWDFAGLTASSVKAQFYSVGTANCEQAQYKDAVTQTMAQIDLMYRVFEKYKDYFMPASSAKDIYTAFDSNRVAGLLAVDGGYALDSRMSVLRDYYRLGVRSVALGGRCSTPWSSSPIDTSPTANETPSDGFLNRTEFGAEIISEMNRLGMLLDLTGITKETQMEAIRNSKAPVIFSSSASNNITEHLLNVDDDVLIELEARGGIIMIPFNSEQLCTDPTNCTVDNIIEHVEHIWQVTNSKNVIGLGGNVGMVNVGNLSLSYPEGFSDSLGYVTLFDKLLQNGNWSVNDLQDLAGNNFIRVLRQVEDVAAQSADQAPAEVAININEIPVNDRGCYTSDEGLLQTSALRIARALSNFQDSLYSFQGGQSTVTGTASTSDGETTAGGQSTGTETASSSSGGATSEGQSTGTVTASSSSGATTAEGQSTGTVTTSSSSGGATSEGGSTGTATASGPNGATSPRGQSTASGATSPPTPATDGTSAGGGSSPTPSTDSSTVICVSYVILFLQLLHAVL